jgi:hypothetical protein
VRGNRSSPSLQSDWLFTVSSSWPDRTKIKSFQKVGPSNAPSGGCSARVGAYEDPEALHGRSRIALGTVICLVAGAVAMGSSGVGVLIPETGRPLRDWITAVDGAGGLFFVGAWLVILMGFWGSSRWWVSTTPFDRLGR